MTLKLPLAPLALVTLVAASPALGSPDQSWDEASSVARDGLIIAALGVPLLKKDSAGGLQAAASMGAAFGATAGLKEAFPEWRPDRSNRKSFPSGHTSVSFAAAANLQNRYGRKFGIPAHVAAAFVAIARVKARKHDWDDVLAGAAIGEAAGLLVTRRRSSTMVVIPYGDLRHAGVVLAMRF